MSRRIGIAVIVVAALLALPAGAAAATRYAAPGGGVALGCPQSEPCSLAVAIEAAGSGDEVLVGAGEYPVAATIEATVPLTVRGESAAAKPRIVGALEVTPLKSFEPLVLSDLRIESTATGTGTVFAPADGSVFDQLELLASGEGALALRPGVNFTLTDSLLVANGTSNPAGVFVQGTANGAPQLRNDTILATGPESIAVSLVVVAAGKAVAIAATNVIASAETDAVANAVGTGSTATIAFDHSNLDTGEGGVTSTDGQTAPPVFVDAAAGNFREQLSSPTVDAGLNAAENGATDLEGNPRSLPREITCAGPGPAITDIGAYEFVPVAPTCPPAMSTPAAPIAAAVPQTRIVRARIRARRAKFRFTASGISTVASFECRLDRAKFRPCASPRIYKHLRPGKHVFRVRATADGQTDPTPAKRRFHIKRLFRHRHHRHHR
jgi:hypothetical protein